jgi:ribosome recycling factor
MDEDDLANLVMDDTKEKMVKAIDHVRSEMGNIRTGRASSALVETLTVDYYGTPTSLRQLAGFSVPDAMLLVISPYDKGSLGAIEKAIQTSDLGINPTNDGTVIRLAFPPLTEERRKELVKVVRHKAEEGRVAIRNLRRSGRHELDALAKDGSLSTDELERIEKELDKITHDQVATIDQLLSHKEHELLQV